MDEFCRLGPSGGNGGTQGWRGLIPEGTREEVIVETDSLELVLMWHNKGKQCSELLQS